MNILNRIIKWLRKYSFYRTKVILFSILATTVTFDIFIEFDLSKKIFNYGNNSSSNLVLVSLIITCCLFIGFDFWLEKTKSNERKEKEIALLIKDSKVPNSIKKELAKALLKNKK